MEDRSFSVRRSVSATETRKTRIVCISDTHNAAPGEGYKLPKGDILIHAGDLTNQGSLSEIKKTVAWLEKADCAVKIVVAGNHDLSLDPEYRLKYDERWKVTPQHEEECRALLRSIPRLVYLEHSSTVVHMDGIRLQIFGSPYSPDRLTQNWAFQYTEDRAQQLWKAIPSDTDVLITHTPPSGFVDESKHWKLGGCPYLTEAIQKIKPLLHICGHCHEGRGAQIVSWSGSEDAKYSVTEWQDPGAGNKKQSLLDLTAGRGSYNLKAGKETAIVNASIMARSYGHGTKVFNNPIVVDLDLPVDPEAIECRLGMEE